MRQKQKTQISIFYYLLPAFLGWVGLIIGYFLIRRENKNLTRKFLIHGIIIIIFVMIFAAILASWAVTFSTTRLAELEAAVIK